MLKILTDLPRYIEAEDVKFLQNSRENVLNQMLEEISKIDKVRLDKYNAKLDGWKSKNEAYAPCVQAQADMKKASAMSARVSSIYTVIRSIANHLGPWFAFIIILIMIVLMVSYSTSKSKKPFSKLQFMKDSKLAEQINPSKWFSSIFPSGINPFKSVTKLASRVTIKNNVDGIDRPTLKGGRCGNTWIDAGDTCLNTQNPEPYKTGITENEQDVYMPWLIQGTFYVPQCENTFVKDDGTGKSKMTDTIYFNDLGLRCSSDNKVRPKPINAASLTTSTKDTKSKSSSNTNENNIDMQENDGSNQLGSFVLISGQ